MTLVKTAAEIGILKICGRKLAEIRQRVLDDIKPGAVPLQIDNLANKLIQEAGGRPSFMTVKDYKWATCINVNDEVVHGIPRDKPLTEGDVVGIDVGLFYKGFHTDTSWTKVVGGQKTENGGQISEDKRRIERFLEIGEEALKKAIDQAKVGNRVGHISKAIQDTIEEAGYSVVRSLVGHGIGKKLHEPPQIPGVLTRKIEDTSALQQDMVLAIEVIYNMGKPEITYKNNDGWTLATLDGSISGLFEETVAVTAKGPIVLTRSS